MEALKDEVKESALCRLVRAEQCLENWQSGWPSTSCNPAGLVAAQIEYAAAKEAVVALGIKP